MSAQPNTLAHRMNHFWRQSLRHQQRHGHKSKGRLGEAGVAVHRSAIIAKETGSRANERKQQSVTWPLSIRCQAWCVVPRERTVAAAKRRFGHELLSRR